MNRNHTFIHTYIHTYTHTNTYAHTYIHTHIHTHIHTYNLLPELYGEQSCTANVHLLSHLTKFVRLWGPLWTHSSFRYENKNGNIKHNRSDVVTQLLFNIDVSVTLQHLYPVLRTSEAEETVKFLSPLSNTPGRRCMIKLGEHLYIVGKPWSTIFQEDEATALGQEAEATVEVFTRLFKEGVLYHSKSFCTEGKRDDTMCSYRHQGRICFGQIQQFLSVIHADILPSAIYTLPSTHCRNVIYYHSQLYQFHR